MEKKRSSSKNKMAKIMFSRCKKIYIECPKDVGWILQNYLENSNKSDLTNCVQMFIPIDARHVEQFIEIIKDNGLIKATNELSGPSFMVTEAGNKHIAKYC